jgi:putative phosphoribosyl transferase
VVLASAVSIRLDEWAAVADLRRQEPARIVVAVPAAARATCAALANEVDEVVCVATPEPFSAVGQAYDDVTQNTDADVRELLAAASS